MHRPLDFKTVATCVSEWSSDNTIILLTRYACPPQVSMPGMMDTVLNLGLNDAIIKGLAAKRGERFAYDCYR